MFHKFRVLLVLLIELQIVSVLIQTAPYFEVHFMDQHKEFLHRLPIEFALILGSTTVFTNPFFLSRLQVMRSKPLKHKSFRKDLD